jgi:hypothetical protein
MAKQRNYSLEEPIGFTRVSEDVLVPSWMVEFTKSYELYRKNPFKRNRILIWFLLVMWLLLTIASPAKFRFEAGIFAAGMLSLIGIIWHLSMLIPPQWLEIDRKDGLITCWSSKKKKKVIAQAHIDQLAFKSVRRKVSTNGKLGRIEYRYLICLEYNDNRKKNLFFDLFDLFEDGKRWDEITAEGFSVAWSLTQSIEQFVRKFMQGEPVPVATKSSYKFKFK